MTTLEAGLHGIQPTNAGLSLISKNALRQRFAGRAYLEAFQVTGNDSYRQVVTEVLDYVLREMTDDQGAFYSATDADSEGEEGKFFVWTPEQVAQALDNEDCRRCCAVYDITKQGNWEHKNIPNRMRPLDVIAQELQVPIEELRDSVRRGRALLYEARARRVPPGLDDKIITAWNGMMISAMAEAGRVLDRPEYIEAARRSAEYLLRMHYTKDNRLLRTSRKGRAHHDAVLEDYAYLGEGLVDLYEAGGEERFLERAGALAVPLLESFQDHELGGFYHHGKDHEALIVRGREGADGATPSGNAVAATFLARLSFHLDRPEFREAAVAAMRAYGKQMSRYPRGFAKSLSLVDFLTEGPVELALIGAKDDPAFSALRDTVRTMYLPNRILATSHRTDGASSHPLLAGKKPVDGRTALYICRDFSCQQPLIDPVSAAEVFFPPLYPLGFHRGRQETTGPDARWFSHRRRIGTIRRQNGESASDSWSVRTRLYGIRIDRVNRFETGLRRVSCRRERA